LPELVGGARRRYNGPMELVNVLNYRPVRKNGGIAREEVAMIVAVIRKG
jgi:hypothetical protein